MENMLEKLKALVKEKPTQYGKILKSEKYSDLLAWVNAQVSPLLDNSFYTLKTKIYWILNGIHSFDDERCKCHSCHKPLVDKNVYDLKIGYMACSQRCSVKDKKRAEKIQNTFMEKHGVTNYFLTEEGKKRQRDWLKEHGVENAFQLDSIKEKGLR